MSCRLGVHRSLIDVQGGGRHHNHESTSWTTGLQPGHPALLDVNSDIPDEGDSISNLSDATSMTADNNDVIMMTDIADNSLDPIYHLCKMARRTSYND